MSGAAGSSAEADYAAFIAAKAHATIFPGIDASEFSAFLFPHQRDLVRWALKKGRAAVFADTGLGKTAIELEWARHVAQRGRVLILSPLAVASQIQREGHKFGIPVTSVRRDDEKNRIVVTNYENFQHFDPADFVGVVLDESSILKSFNGSTRTELIEAFKETPFRLAATATPAPNDFTELGNHSEFLGVKTRTEMLAEYFVHDMDTTQDWRIKGHAVQAFWTWIATWGAVIRSPADLGYDDTSYRLPPLRMNEIVIPSDEVPDGRLFATNASTLSDQRAVRRNTLPKRIEAVGELVGSFAGKPCLIWCELNEEQERLEATFGERAFSVTGSLDADEKITRVEAWLRGERPIMISKPSIMGFGLNFQHCARMIFLGASHSYEQTYQAIRRCWRFGQTSPVDVHIVRADTEQLVVDNYRRKEADAARMGAEMASKVLASVRAEVQGASFREWNAYAPGADLIVPDWLARAAQETA